MSDPTTDFNWPKSSGKAQKLSTEELVTELRRRGQIVYDDTKLLASAAANLRAVGAIVIERDENGEWPEWFVALVAAYFNDQFSDRPADDPLLRAMAKRLGNRLATNQPGARNIADKEAGL